MGDVSLASCAFTHSTAALRLGLDPRRSWDRVLLGRTIPATPRFHLEIQTQGHLPGAVVCILSRLLRIQYAECARTAYICGWRRIVGVIDHICKSGFEAPESDCRRNRTGRLSTGNCVLIAEMMPLRWFKSVPGEHVTPLRNLCA
jgi:hypothetical protein